LLQEQVYTRSIFHILLVVGL